jgi:ribonuclease BN (tRNA processing enzyme)
MQLRFVGSGDAFGSGGRYNTCFHVTGERFNFLIDCGASSLPALKRNGIDRNKIEFVLITHFHGDHFGGLPFLLLDAQFLSRREKPLTIAGPPGTRARLDAAMEVLFPKSTGSKWRFAWQVTEMPVGVESDVLGHSLLTAEVIHQSGAPSTALRITDGEKIFAYSGDTEWTEALLPIAAGADLFICECYGYAGKITGHITWEILQARLADLRAKRTMVTHMNPTVLARLDEIEAAGVLIAADGLVVDF